MPTRRSPGPGTRLRAATPGALAGALRLGVRLVRDLRLALGALLLVGLGLALLGAWAFVGLAGLVMEGETQQFDEAVLRRLDAIDFPWIELALLEVTALGNGTVVVAVTVIAATFLWLTRHRYSAGLLIAATTGGTLLSFLLKAYFARPRPQVVTWGTHVATSSFPSGHATSAVVVYATVAYLAATLQRGRWARAATLTIAALVVALIAASRLFLGVHYPSDVVAGIIIGLAWTAFCVAVLEALHRFILREAPEEAAHEDPLPEADREDASDTDAAAARDAAHAAVADRAPRRASGARPPRDG